MVLVDLLVVRLSNCVEIIVCPVEEGAVRAAVNYALPPLTNINFTITENLVKRFLLCSSMTRPMERK
jgi:hypothetical protein